MTGDGHLPVRRRLVRAAPVEVRLEEPPQASTMMPSYTPRLSYMPPHVPPSQMMANYMQRQMRRDQMEMSRC